MNYIELISLFFSASGLWKLTDLLIQFFLNRKKHLAEEKNIQVQTESQLVNNWVQWSQSLERRVKELEGVGAENQKLKSQMSIQIKRINELEGKVDQLEKVNKDLFRLVLELKKQIKV